MQVEQVKAVLTADISNFVSGFGMASQAMEGFQKKTLGLKEIGNMAGVVGKGLTTGLTLPLVGIGAASVKTAADFGAGMSKVQAISGASSKDMLKLSDMAKKMGATTKFSATQSADALSYMAMAGWKTDQMISGLPGVMNLAAASGEDLAMVSDIVTDSLTGFGLKAKDSGRFADILAAASSNANTNVGMMGETFKYAAPLAGTLGYNVEDTAVAIGLMANAGIKGSQAGTTLRTTFSRLAAPTAEVNKGMQMLGLSIKDVQGLSLDETLSVFREKFASLDKTQQAQAASMIFGKQAMSGMLAVINASEEEYNNLQDAIYNSSGAAEKMAKIMQDNLKGSVIELKSALEGMAIAIGERLAPNLRKAVDFIKDLATAFNELPPSTQDTIVNFGVLLATIGPLLMIFSKLAGIFLAVKGKLTLLSAAFSSASAIWAGAATPLTFLGGLLLKLKGALLAVAPALAGLPFAAVVAGAVAAGFAIYKLVNHLKESAIQTDVFGENVSEGTKKAVQGFLDLNTQAKTALDQLNWSGQQVTSQMAQGIVQNFQAMNEQIVGKLQQQKESVLTSLQGMYSEMGILQDQDTQMKLQKIAESYDQQILKEQEGLARVKEILNLARNEKRALTQQEATEINAIREQMKNDGVRILSESEQEYKVIQQRMKDQAGALSAEMAAEVVKNSLKQKEETVANANAEYDERIKAAEQLRAQGGEEANAMADEIIEAAKRQRDEAVSQAEDMHSRIVAEAQAQAQEHVNQVDWETGEVKTKWEELRDNVTRTAKELAQSLISKQKEATKQLITSWGELKTQATQKVKEMAKSVSDGFSNMVKAVNEKMNNIIQGVKKGWSNAMTAAKSFMSQARSIGSNIIQGMVNGVVSKAASLAQAAANAVRRAINAAKSALGIHSPSRVFREIGIFTIQGMENGIDKQAPKLVRDVGGVAKDVINAFGQPSLDVATSMNRINGVNSQVDHLVQSNISDKKPAYINLNLGGRSFKAFVEDISNVQGVEANLEEAFGF